MDYLQLLMTAFYLLLIGAAVALLAAGRSRLGGWLSLLFVTASSVLLIVVAVGIWRGGAATTEESLLVAESLGAQLTLQVDALSALFLSILAVVAFCCTLYSIEYLPIYQGESARRYYPLLLLLFASIIGVVTVSDMLFFFVFWELMTLTSWALVVYEQSNPVSLRAGLKYFVITHIATAGMFIGSLVVWNQPGSHSFSFTTMSKVLANLASSNPVVMYTVLALFFIGFATKAGVLPFGDWLPDAYPAAPSGASAAFAGTMSKLGIYGMLRVIVGMVPTAEAAVVWGIVIAIFGTASIFFGTLAALAQDDSKRLMSFHVIGQIGYMMLGIGVGLCLLPSAPVLGALAMIAGTFHLINNVCYKSCLLMNAGSVLYRTGTRDLNRVGGLSQLMPWTAATAAVAALSIAGVPPLSGFASKWMIYASTITAGIKHPLFLILALVALFVSLVTLASFLKFFGSAFLGKLAAGKAKEGEREVPFTMVLPQAILALLCVLFGLVPVLAVTAVYHAVGSTMATSAAGFEFPALSKLIGDSWFGIQMKTDGSDAGVWIPLVVLAALVACLVLAIIIRWLGGAPVRQVSSWYGGEEHADELVRGRAHGFVLPFKKAFSRVYPQIGLPHWGYPRWLQQVFDLDSWLYARRGRGAGGG